MHRRSIAEAHRFGGISVLLEFFLARFAALQFDLRFGEARVGVAQVAIEPKAVLKQKQQK